MYKSLDDLCSHKVEVELAVRSIYLIKLLQNFPSLSPFQFFLSQMEMEDLVLHSLRSELENESDPGLLIRSVSDYLSLLKSDVPLCCAIDEAQELFKVLPCSFLPKNVEEEDIFMKEAKSKVVMDWSNLRSFFYIATRSIREYLPLIICGTSICPTFETVAENVFFSSFPLCSDPRAALSECLNLEGCSDEELQAGDAQSLLDEIKKSRYPFQFPSKVKYFMKLPVSEIWELMKARFRIPFFTVRWICLILHLVREKKLEVQKASVFHVAMCLSVALSVGILSQQVNEFLSSDHDNRKALLESLVVDWKIDHHSRFKYERSSNVGFIFEALCFLEISGGEKNCTLREKIVFETIVHTLQINGLNFKNWVDSFSGKVDTDV